MQVLLFCILLAYILKKEEEEKKNNNNNNNNLMSGGVNLICTTQWLLVPKTRSIVFKPLFFGGLFKKFF